MRRAATTPAVRYRIKRGIENVAISIVETAARMRKDASHAGATYWPALNICWQMGQLAGSSLSGTLMGLDDPSIFKTIILATSDCL